MRPWARRGTRPTQPADQRYDNAYLFGAICPARGVGAALAFPMHTDMMQLHLDEISRNVAKDGFSSGAREGRKIGVMFSGTSTLPVVFHPARSSSRTACAAHMGQPA